MNNSSEALKTQRVEEIIHTYFLYKHYGMWFRMFINTHHLKQRNRNLNHGLKTQFGSGLNIKDT